MGRRYATGRNALGICERSGKKMLRRLLVHDGQYPDMLVAPDEWDPKHPQEYLADVSDPEAIHNPTGDPDKEAAKDDDTTDIFDPDLFGG